MIRETGIVTARPSYDRFGIAVVLKLLNVVFKHGDLGLQLLQSSFSIGIYSSESHVSWWYLVELWLD